MWNKVEEECGPGEESVEGGVLLLSDDQEGEHVEKKPICGSK